MFTQYYFPNSILNILNDNLEPAFCKGSKDKVMNEAISFDIEATSTYTKDGKKIAFMYAWALDIFDCTIIGREWSEFVNTINTISNFYGLNPKKRIIVYVHNLSYDLQFFRKWFEWDYIFSTHTRKPLYAITKNGIEFRCSLRLSGYKLSKVGEQMGIEKLPDFNYTEIRTPITKLTFREYQYIIHDVKIVSAYIRKKIADESGIINIPFTKTGYVRRLCRHKCLRDKYKSGYYSKMIHTMVLTFDEYLTAKSAFMGGFTHTAFNHSGHVRYNVRSFDFNSSYPTVLIAEKYPMSAGEEIKHCSKKELSERLESSQCAIVELELENVKNKFKYESYLSQSRCSICEANETTKVIINNGRVYSAGKIVVTITNVDYQIMKKVYDFDIVRYNHFYVYKTEYLPKPFVECILELYKTKTELKGVPNVDEEYMNAKENLNSMYGMTVTDIVRKFIDYDYDENEWDDIIRVRNKLPPKEFTDAEKEKQIEKENKKKGRFMYYLWGIFCTAYARRNLWYGITECGYDYIYSDTDSIKILNAENHMDFINRYNNWISERLEMAMDFHKLPHELIRPKNKFGKEKPLGVWDNDGNYRKFKALRAKSYMYQKEKPDPIDFIKPNHLKLTRTGSKMPNVWLKKFLYGLRTYHMTVAGVNGNRASEYLLRGNVDNPLSLFNDFLHIPAEWTGKLTHTYCDIPFTARIIDKDGNAFVVHEKSYVHLAPCSFDMSLGKQYRSFLLGVKQGLIK